MTKVFELKDIKGIDIAESSVETTSGEVMMLIEFLETYNSEASKLDWLTIITALFGQGFCRIDTGNGTFEVIRLVGISHIDDRGIPLPDIV